MYQLKRLPFSINLQLRVVPVYAAVLWTEIVKSVKQTVFLSIQCTVSKVIPRVRSVAFWPWHRPTIVLLLVYCRHNFTDNMCTIILIKPQYQKTIVFFTALYQLERLPQQSWSTRHSTVDSALWTEKSVKETLFLWEHCVVWKVTTSVRSAVFRPRHRLAIVLLLLYCPIDNTLFGCGKSILLLCKPRSWF